MSIIPFPRFQLEKSRKAVFKECAKLDLVISLKSHRLPEEREFLFFRVKKPSKVTGDKLGKARFFTQKFYVFWENL